MTPPADKLKPRIRLALGQALEELVDMLDEVHRDHHEADPRATPRDSIALTVDVFLESVDLPWGAPVAILRPAMIAALDSALKQRLTR